MTRLLNSLGLCLSLILGLVITQASAAVSLQQAKSQGWVGELYTGYVALTPVGKQQPSATRQDLDKLVKSINAQRKTAYERIAAQEGTALSVVESLAGEKSLNKTPSGQYIQLPKSGWRKK